MLWMVTAAMKLKDTYSLEEKLCQTCAVLCLLTQSCLILCDPMDCSLPGFSVHEDSPGKNTEVGCHALLQGIFPTQDSVLKSRDVTLPKEVHIVKAVVFPLGMYGCESWTIKKAECRRIDT